MTNKFLQPIGTLQIIDIEPNYSMTFQNPEGQIGCLDFNGPAMTFEGNAEESAKVFLYFLAQAFEQRLKDEREAAIEATKEKAAKVCEEPMYFCQSRAKTSGECAAAIRSMK